MTQLADSSLCIASMDIDYDKQIASAKAALAEDIKHAREKCAKMVADLEAAKQKQAEHAAWQKRLKYATSASGLKYRVATDKMLSYAKSIENASLTDGAQMQDCYRSIETLEDYAKKLDFIELDSFDLVKSYISAYADEAKRIWEANKQESKRRREEAYYGSWQHRLDQRRQKCAEEQARQAEEARAYDLSHRVYDGDGGFWMTGFGSNGMHVDKFGES